MLAFMAGAGYRIPVGTSVSLTPMRPPLQAAVEARSLALLTGAPVTAGFVAATPEFVAYVRGEPYRRPAVAVRDYLLGVRAFLDSANPVLPPLGDRAGDPAVGPARRVEVELGAGVLRRGMARAAGESADVAITWMTPPDYVKGTIAPALREGAGDGRPPPRITTVVHVAIARPGRDAAHLAYAAAQGHLRSPHYADMLRRAGCGVDPRDPGSGARRLVDSGIFVFGTPEQIMAALHEYERAGVDEVVLNAAGVHVTEGCQAAVEDAAEILEASRAVRAAGAAVT
ncbi:LLM class flavin-dependent oxidoreductase [Microbispora sp. H10836]|uniref:LLM class flavin-dependent oxidoreductase n=1 Tax=Microbispora sp. H10836 TaxID=2729106 RepID=UPI0014766F9B|nr:LLM class flavin-dependent oxidoreductase [Microbispora sp. H10836]